jgi:hypothetical protein
VFIAWTWNQLVHEAGIFAAGMIVIACLVYLARKVPSALRKRERELLERGIATGLVDKAREPCHRFSLMDLLVVVTLAAALAGLVLGMSSANKGIPADQLWKEFDRQNRQPAK